ncbi:ABC transporter permease [Butyrivibrio sp. LC3010]|uniref:ABC transporter permease n=1 Tax=Butyrivibrio sp. LC3010 TaxID=1280680 RepID=UPI0004138548|nr:FtsX-like permease family protein [Butyrivibrio sp. LC3010]
MNIISKLTLRHLLENKKRSIVTILGIATSTALISAILLGVFSFFSFFGYISVQTSGAAHTVFEKVSKEQYKELLNDKTLETVGLRELDGKKSGVRLLTDTDERFRVGNIDHATMKDYSMRVVSDYEGNLPVNSSEIAVEEKFLKDNGLDLKVGDELTFEEGYRYIDDELEGFSYLGGTYRSDELFKANSAETCTITAILHGNRATKDWDILRGMDDGYFPKQDAAQVSIMLKKCNSSAIKQIKDIVKKYGIQKYTINTEYMLSRFAFEGSAGSYKSFFVLMGIALIIVIATSVILIFNSIGMSLTERMRYLGMLASVGATARQKRFSIYYEGVVLGIIGIPLGLLLGYIGTRITLAILGRRILEADILAGAEGMRGTIPIVCQPSVIIAIIFFSALTIMLSVLVPGIKAARIMPIDALRQSTTIKVRARNLRVNPLIRKIFGYEGELAYKNIKRNGGKGKVITISIAVSIILFLTINFFCSSIARANNYNVDIPYQIIASCTLDESDRLRSEIRDMDGVKDVYSAGMIQFAFKKKPDDKYTTLANTDIADRAFLTESFRDKPDAFDLYSMSVAIVDDEDFNKILDENGLSREDYYSGQLRGVLLNSYFHEVNDAPVFNDGIIGQSLHYDETMGFPPAIEVAARVPYTADNKVLEYVPRGTMTVFVPRSVYYEKAKEVLPEDKLTLDLAVETTDNKAVYSKIYQLMQEEGYHNYYCTDLTDSLKIMDTITLMLNTAMYGFSTLLTLIAVANIVNTISTGVLLRRKEFAMYKSVGLDNLGFKKMIWLEVFLYGFKALLWGIPISLLLSFMMYKSFDSALYTFNPNLLFYGVVVLAVFGILGISMGLSINKIKDDNIIEALKEDAV